MSRKLDRRSLQSCLFQLTALVNAIRFFAGTAIPDFEGDKKKIGQYADYCRSCLDHSLGDAWSPLKEDNCITLYDQEGDALVDVKFDTVMDQQLTDEFITTWWEMIQPTVKANEHDNPRMCRVVIYFFDHIAQIMEIADKTNKSGKIRPIISQSTIKAVRAAQEMM